jgi:hypothetical protein
MARTFVSVTQAEIDLRLAENLRSRELELLAYDFEQANHLAAIMAFGPIQWEAGTVQYKGLARDAMIARALADGLDSAAIQAIADLNTLDAHKLNLEAVRMETAKSERHYSNLLTALPSGARRDVALAAAAAKEAARIAK